MFEFIGIMTAIEEVFRLGFELGEEDFLELEYYQYRRLMDDGYDVKNKWYCINPEKSYNSGLYKETFIVNEEYKVDLLKAVLFINKQAKKCNKELLTFQEKIFYVRSTLPPRFSQDDKTKHEGKVVKLFSEKPQEKGRK